jgi:hypothetical protein
MPNIIGIPAGKMIRESVVSDTDVLGLTRLTESYAFATSEFQTFRTRLINLTPYNTVMNYVYPTATTTYPYVVIDSASITEEAGGISSAVVQYVGILKPTKANAGDTSWLPPAKQKLIPGNTALNPIVVVDFIYYSDSVSPELEMLNKFSLGTQLPQTINGTNLYRSPVAPYGIGSRVGVPSRLAPNEFVSQEIYFGMRCSSHFSERVGLFYKITNTYEDSGVLTTNSNPPSTQRFGPLPR